MPNMPGSSPISACPLWNCCHRSLVNVSSIWAAAMARSPSNSHHLGVTYKGALQRGALAFGDVPEAQGAGLGRHPEVLVEVSGGPARPPQPVPNDRCGRLRCGSQPVRFATDRTSQVGETLP